MTGLRTNTKFHQSKVTQVLPQFFQGQYPNLIKFLEAYYDFAGEETEAAQRSKSYLTYAISLRLT